MAGLVAYGTYVPYWRLERSAVASALGGGGGRGTRAVASYDEDSTSMGVEAARVALAAARVDPDLLLFVTTSPAYADKTNASAIHAALGLPERAGAYDMAGALRSASGALRLAWSSSASSLVVCSDVRTGLPSSADESNGGDAAAAFVFSASEPALVEVAGEASASQEFLDRWRAPGEVAAKVWEERFGETVYVPAAKAAIGDACKDAGIALDAVDRLIVTGLHARSVRTLVGWTGVAAEKVAGDLSGQVGNTGSVHVGLMLADALDRAEPGEAILVVHLADGAEAVVLRTTDALASYRQRRVATVAEQVTAGRTGLPYSRFLSWRGLLDREPPRRPDPDAPSAPLSFRREPWKFGFTASRCEVCGRRHLPPARVCLECGSVDQMQSERLADVRGTVATFTIDRLAYSPSPPVVAAVVDFDGGGRLVCEMTDVEADEVAVGDRVAMTFRRLYTAPNGVHNYFWKARPITEEAG